MSKIPAINEIDANSPSQESTEVVVKATTVTPDINEIQETISASATIQEIDGTRKPTISEIYKIVNDGLFESTTNWWDYAYKLSQAQLNQDIISRLDNGVIGGGYSKGVDIITTTSNKVPSNTNVYSALKSDYLYPKKLNDEVINGIYDFLNGLTIGKPTAYTGGTWSVDQMGKTHLTTDYLYVRLKAIFETLQILNVDTIGGKLVISPAGSIRVAYVDKIKIDAPVFKHDENTDVWSISQVEDTEGNLVNETLNQEVYRCYFLGEQDGEEIDNKWKVGDQAQAKTFNVKKGTYHKVENSYLWRLVVNISSDTVDIDGKKYHYVDLSQIDFDSGSDAPAPGDVLNQLGHRLNDTQRQTALVLNAVDNYAPSITLYAGINYYTLLNKEYVEFGVYNGKAFFNVYGDMYIGDKGENPKTYIKYKNGKINIKANLEIGSSIGDKDLDQYIKENGGVDEETVNNLINNSQVIKDLQKQTDGAIETWFYEGVPTLDNLPAVDWTTGDLKKKHIGDLYYDQTTGYAYRFTKYNDDVNPYRWNRIKDNDIVAALDAASRAQATADGKMKVFYGKTKPTNYQVGDMWVNATLEGKFNNDIARAVADNKTSFNANDWVLASRYSEAIATIQKWTNEYETKFSNLVDEVKRQKDQSIVVWYYSYEPTVDNAPANTWNTDELRSEHIGDIFYDIKNNHSYRWTGTTWIQIKDADFDKAMKAAKAADDKAGAAGDLADSKRRIFYSDATPTEPFDKGDLWIKRVGDKTETWVYNGTDWVKSDDKALNDFKNAINEELAGIKGQLDGKAETWYQVDDPSTDWTDKASHEGDIWYNTSNGTTNYWNGSAWEQMDIPKDVFDTIDGKSSIFVDSYVDAKAGTGVISKGYKERDLWIIPEDATVNGVKYYKGDMLTAVSNNTNFDETNWKKKVRYVGPTELNNAIDVVNEKINTINNITIPGINNKFNEFIEDGVLDSSEKARLTDLLNQASNEVAAVIDQVNNIITSKYLTNDNANKGKLEEANTVMKTAWTEYKNLINTLIAANTEITKVNIGEANTKYRNLQEKIKTVKQYLAICQADILSGMGTDITSYKYLKDALNQTTEINGGLVLTSAIQLKDVDKKVTAGMNGIVKGDKTSIAAWYGGPMVDRDTFTSEELETKVPGTDYAMSLLRHDGTGYLAGGNIHWNADGVLSGNFNSFILQGTSIATMFYYIRLFYLHTANPDNTDFNNIDYVTPMKTFSRLSVLPLGGIEGGNNLPTGLFIGDSTTGGSFQIGNIILRTKSGDPNILEIVSASSNKTAHLGVQGGVSAYGTYTPSTGGGGGLNASIKSYANIIAGNYTDSDLTTIPNAYSIKALYNAIQNIDVTGQLGNYLLKSDAASTYQPKGNYLTTHQSIYGLTIQKNGTNIGNYTPNSKSATINISVPTKVSQLTNDSGYTKNTGTVTSVGLLVPTGLAVTNSPITTKGVINIAFAEGYSIPTIVKQTSWDGAVSVKHTHTNKTVLDSISSSKVTNWDNVYNWYVLMTTDEETTDGIINKWNEVVSFLANIAQTDTLSGIVDGINKSISDEVTRAKKAEGVNASGISTNKTSITTLQGYFTSGSAKKALQLTNTRKLWGNSFNGTADINGSIIVPDGKYISIGNIKMEYDATNKALKITNTTTNEVANLYTSGGVSAYGVGTSSSSGGGLNGSVKSYSNALKLTSESLSEIASAYSIKALDSRISSLEGGSATSIETTGSGNAVTSVSKSGTKITFTKGSTFSLNGHTHTFASLTSKPTSLSGYGITDGVNAVSVTGSGNAVTAASVSGHTLILTKGSSFSLSNHTHYVGTTQVQGSSAEQALTGITKIDNILKLSKASVTVNTSYKAEQNRLVIYGTTYGNDANYIKSAGKLSYGDGGPQLVFSTSDNPDASGVQSAALVYTDHDTIGAGVSLSFVTNQGDAYFIAPHIKALTAFQGNLAWSYITNKPTTLSGFGITDGLRSVTQPSGSNVFVTGISTSGTAITYTKSYTKKSLSAVGTSGWTNASIDGNIIPDMSFIAYWNGAYSGTSSNLAYCNKGAFGSFAIKNSLAFSELTSKPTTISGYGITDAYTKSQVDTIAAKYLPLTGGTLTGQLKIEASALNGAYNGLRIGDDCYIGDCNFGNTIGLMGVGNNNAGMVKFGKGGMQFGYNGSNHIASTTAQWTNLNADLLDGWHKNNIVWSGAVNSYTASLSHYWAKLFDITVTANQYDDRNFTFLFSNGFNDTFSVVVLRIRQNGAKDSGAYNFIISLRELVGNMSSRLRVYYNNATGNVQLWGNCKCQYGTLSYTIIKKTGRASADFTSQGTLVTNTSFSAAQSLPATTGDSPYTLLDGATRIGIVNQADQLVTARTIWGQSFNGTANVSGALSGATTISASNTISTTLQNGALKIGNKLTPISAIDAQVIFNTGAAIRFGETAWDWNQWAGLKYNHSNKTIYLGIADGSAFNANTPQLDGTLRLAGIKTIIPNAGARIGGNGSLYLGDANNSGWVYVQDMCSQVNNSYWNIRQLGNATFKSLTVNDVISCDSIIVSKNAVINGSLSVAGLINNKGILPANREVNDKGPNCYVSADALCSGITAITDSIQVNQVTVQYSNDNGNSWTNYSMSNDAKFNLYANNAGLNQVYLGYNVITGNNDAEKLSQIKKNELIVSFYISDSCYAQPYFASVDMWNGIYTICTVEILNNSGAVVETYTKRMTGWNQINYISLLSNSNTPYSVGNDSRRYIRFRFKHDQNTTALRNTVINKIRIFSFTKHSFPTDRFMGHTGHIYNFDYNMNTYFPNSILAKGGVTAYQSSDIRLKTNIAKLNCLNVIKSIGGTYEFDYIRDHKHSIGFIAQNVNNPLLKDIIAKDDNGYLKINYWNPKLISLAFGALTEIDDEVDKLKARVRELESEVEYLKNKAYALQ